MVWKLRELPKLNVGGFEIAVHNSCLVRRFERIGNLQAIPSG